MTITIDVQGYRGIDRAQISCDPICLVTAVNDAGKTSIAEAVAAALTGSALADHLELTMKSATAVVHSGAKAGLCVIKGEGGESRISWPECQLSTSGADHPHASVFAVGQKTIAEGMNSKERASALERYLKSHPTKDDLTAAMQPGVLFVQASIDALWDEIAKKGWDNTAGTYDQARRDASRDWSRITGETFGSDKSANWQPSGLDLTLTLADLDGAVSKAQTDVESAVANNAIGEAELATLKELAGELDSRASRFAQIEQQVATARTAAHEALRARQNLPPAPTTSAILTCPCCGEKLSYLMTDNQLTLEKYQAPDDKVLRQRRLAIADADGTVSRTASVVKTLEGQLATASAAVRSATEARDKLANLGEKKEGNPDLLVNARAVLETARATLRLRKQYDEAMTAYRRWKGSDLKLQLLQPDGLRAKKLGEAVHAFNDHILAPLCEVAGWPLTKITEGLTVMVGEFPYSLRSEGIKWRARVILQGAMAQLDGSSMLIIDNLPDLDMPARNGLFRLLQHLKMPALVCSAEIKGVPVINLAKAGIGGTYMIKDGCTEAVAA